jgi:dipeptide/tripeptide permease
MQGFILLSVQAHLPQLKPPPCNMAATDGGCEQARGIKASIFFAALYLVALGSGCLKPNMIAHGADQFAAAAGGGGDGGRSGGGGGGARTVAALHPKLLEY